MMMMVVVLVVMVETMVMTKTLRNSLGRKGGSKDKNSVHILRRSSKDMLIVIHWLGSYERPSILVVASKLCIFLTRETLVVTMSLIDSFQYKNNGSLFIVFIWSSMFN